MALFDHFRPPLSVRRHWHAFHNAWAVALAADLNQRLPDRYIAEPNVQLDIEIDVATFDQMEIPLEEFDAGWLAPPATGSMPFAFVGETLEVLIQQEQGGLILAGAIELVSPANKDRPAHRQAFVSKCETYLQQGVGLVIVDIVTERHDNLHNELLTRLKGPERLHLEAELYATAYRPVQREQQAHLDVWQEPLALGADLPTMPLWLRGGLCLPIMLQSAYERVCRELKISPESMKAMAGA